VASIVSQRGRSVLMVSLTSLQTVPAGHGT
jgi:hypothetical protein